MALAKWNALLIELSGIAQIRLETLATDLKRLVNWYKNRTGIQRWLIGASGFSVTVLASHRLFSYLSRKNNKQPPGLIGIPYFGSFFTLAYYGEEKFSRSLLPSYGPITMHKIGTTKILTINEINLIKAIIGSQYCALRPPQLSAIYRSVNQSIYVKNVSAKSLLEYKIIAPQAFCNEYRCQRRRVLINAVSKISNKQLIESNVNKLLSTKIFPLLDDISSNNMNTIDNNSNHNSNTSANENKRSWNPDSEMELLSFNITFGALFGSDKILDSNDNDFIAIAKFSTRFGALFGFSILANLFCIPNLIRKYMIDDKLNPEFVQNLADGSSIFEKYMNEAIKNLANKKESDYTLFDEIYKMIKNDANVSSVITDEILLVDVFNLLAAATATTAITLESCLLFSAKYLSLQDEIYKELIQFGSGSGSGSGNDIEYKNIVHCVKFQAFIHEVLRVSAILPTSNPRAVSEPCILRFNYMKSNDDKKRIQKNTTRRVDSQSIIFDKLCNYNSNDKRDCEYIIDELFYIVENLDYVMTQDSNIWGENPCQFNIYHWINMIHESNGETRQTFVKNPNSLPFSIGKRDCLGKTLAMKAIKLILAKLFLKYKFTFENENKDIVYRYMFVKEIHPKINLLAQKR